MSGYTNVFGSSTVPPAEYGYQALVITSDQTLVWPYNYTGSGPVTSKIMEVTCNAGNSLILPAASAVSTGEDLLIRNVGAQTLTVKRADGTTLATVAAGAATYFYVTNNSSAAGVWGQVAFGAGSASISAGALVGYGLQAVASVLNVAFSVLTSGSLSTVDGTYQAQLYNYTGGSGTLSLTSPVTLGNAFWFMFANNGTGTVTVTPAAGTIDGAASKTVQPGESCLIISSGANYYTVGYGRSTVYQFTQLVLDVSAAGTFTLSSAQAANKLMTFIGNPAGAVTVIVPNTVAVYYVQSSISTAQTITLKTAAGTGASIPQGQRVICLCDATNVSAAQSAAVTSSVSLIDGTAATPSLNFASQTNTGLFKHSTADLGFTVSGVQAGYFSSAGLFVTGMINNVTITQPASSATLTIANTKTATFSNSLTFAGTDGKTMTFSNSLTLAGTDGTVMTFPGTSDTVATLTATQILTNKTLGNTNVFTMKDGSFTLQNTADATKQAVLSLAGITTGNTRTLTLPDASFTLAGININQTFSGTQTFGTLVATTFNGNTFTTGTGTLTLGAAATFSVTAAKTPSITNSLTFSGTDGTTMTFPSASASIGYLNIPQNSQSAAYTTVLADAGKHIFHPSADTTARVWTIDSNANVAYPIGTAITFVNQNAGGAITIAITADTMRLAGAGTTGSRTLAANGIATALKVTSTEWIISGTNLT